ncbi:MAG: septum formation protein Maf [Microscillaceae bacterium]|nr:septum formation protein Maf [Microscillaceae bacterium]
MVKMILASQSPRRQDLLHRAGFVFEVKVKPVEEDFPDTLPKPEVPGYLAQKKARAFDQDLLPQQLLLTADTVVILQDQIIGKPASLTEAEEMLHRLSGQKHTVVTGVHLQKDGQNCTFQESSAVFFAPLSRAAIAYYLEREAPLDRAGAYGIQDWIGLVGIQKIEGCFYNVMGLPVARLCAVLQEFAPEVLPVR